MNYEKFVGGGANKLVAIGTVARPSCLFNMF